MTEFSLFLIAGVIAVAAAIMMLLSSSAVHSSLFLVITMVAIAFLFLLLNAPFLAMIQITVYAGAIMVLFLFVIMLLGSEQPEQNEPAEQKPRFRWFLPLAITLSLTLLIAIGLTIVATSQNPSNFQETAQTEPRLRVLHAASSVGEVDVQVDGETVATDIGFRDASSFLTLEPGVHQVVLVPESGEPLTGEVSLVAGTAGTLIAYADATGIKLGYAAEDLTTVDEARSARFVIFNAYPDGTAVSVVDTGSEFVDDDTITIVDNIGLGAASAPVVVAEGMADWLIVQADALNQTIAPLAELEIEGNTSQLVVLTNEDFADGSLTGTVRPATITLSSPARVSFGGPHAIGYLLFTDYLLPFQLLALLLLAAMVGAIVLTHRQLLQPTTRVGGRRRVSRPLVNVIAAQVGHDVTEESEAKRLPDEPEAVGN